MKQWNEVFKREGKFFLKPHEDMPKIVKLFKKRSVKKVLDLGCGSGRHVVYLAEHGFEVYGIDIAEAGIQIAQDWLRRNDLNADFKIGNLFRELPYKDGFFDAVISIQVLHHARIKDVRDAIKEIERVLKPEGLVFITVPGRRSGGKIRPIIVKSAKKIEPRTYVPLKGSEAGLPHYIYNTNLLRKDFRNFKVHDLWTDSKDYYCLLGELKTPKSAKLILLG